VVSNHHGIRQLWINLTRNIARWKRERLAGRAAGVIARVGSPGRMSRRWRAPYGMQPLPSSSACASGLRSALALYVAFWLQLDDAQWAGTSAAIVCQPSLGASLRKGSSRMLGTAIGAVAILVLAVCFPQSRSGFLLGLALWGSVCGFFATIFRNNASYAAALAGYTAAIIAGDLLGPTGGANGSVLILAIDRASEICIGIVCAGMVLAGTDFGGARYRLAAQFAAVAAEITKRFVGTFSLAGPEQSATRPVRRGVVGRVIALGPVIDEAIGETAGLRYRWRGLQAAVDGLFAAISGWRAVATNLELMPGEQGRHEANVILQTLPQDLRSEPTQGDAAIWAAEPSRLRLACRTAVRALLRLPTATPSLRLMADATAGALLGISRALDGLSLLTHPARVMPPRRVLAFACPIRCPLASVQRVCSSRSLPLSSSGS
jgi:Fusaric acid resistance protein family